MLTTTELAGREWTMTDAAKEQRQREVFGRWLQLEMDRRGMKAVHLANRAGVWPSTVGWILKGEKTARPETLKKFAKALGLPQDVLFIAAGLKTESAESGGKVLDPLTMTGTRELLRMTQRQRQAAVEMLMAMNRNLADEPVSENGHEAGGAGGEDRKKPKPRPVGAG
jgi:transcriptional regulator with XRE-family HTH domain